jgi:hypothetical protein
MGSVIWIVLVLGFVVVVEEEEEDEVEEGEGGRGARDMLNSQGSRGLYGVVKSFVRIPRPSFIHSFKEYMYKIKKCELFIMYKYKKCESI